jgi:hypothetical protein
MVYFQLLLSNILAVPAAANMAATISSATGIDLVTDDVTSTFSKAAIDSVSPAGKTLMQNKAMMNNALTAMQITDKQTIALMFAIGFIETDHLCALEALSQNKTNPKSGLSTNFGFINLNLEAIQDSGTSLPSSLADISTLNATLTVDTQDAMEKTLDIANKLIHKHQKIGFINQHRGGKDGLNSKGEDCFPHKCKEYRNHAAARAYAILQDPALLTNNVRLQGPVPPA